MGARDNVRHSWLEVGMPGFEYLLGYLLGKFLNFNTVISMANIRNHDGFLLLDTE